MVSCSEAILKHFAYIPKYVHLQGVLCVCVCVYIHIYTDNDP